MSNVLVFIEQRAIHHRADVALACGAGDVAFHAANAGAVVTGSDLSPALVETAERRAAAL